VCVCAGCACSAGGAIGIAERKGMRVDGSDEVECCAGVAFVEIWYTGCIEAGIIKAKRRR